MVITGCKKKMAVMFTNICQYVTDEIIRILGHEELRCSAPHVVQHVLRLHHNAAWSSTLLAGHDDGAVGP